VREVVVVVVDLPGKWTVVVVRATLADLLGGLRSLIVVVVE
jgi:hypothetical protein